VVQQSAPFQLPDSFRVLIVDDIPTTRKLMREILFGVGFKNIIEAKDGNEALAKIKEKRFNLIISDWNMPQMQGIDLLREVRGDRLHKQVPFLMVTAEVNKLNVMEAVQAGVTHYLAKPYTGQELIAALEKTLQQKSD